MVLPLKQGFGLVGYNVRTAVFVLSITGLYVERKFQQVATGRRDLINVVDNAMLVPNHTTKRMKVDSFGP